MEKNEKELTREFDNIIKKLERGDFIVPSDYFKLIFIDNFQPVIQPSETIKSAIKSIDSEEFSKVKNKFFEKDTAIPIKDSEIVGKLFLILAFLRAKQLFTSKIDEKINELLKHKITLNEETD